ncbi:MAG TPA: alpha-amylase family glycosyl hydrolase, partial [Ferruginibacter sp.]|nr:alpha-amylase family glycosyl hydrolase [Ferruginibacter sp.]
MTEQTFNRAYWLPSTNIYEVNIRQYTPEGTFNAFSASLPRLKDMGVEVLWLMPIHPIGEKNRKGSLGSYYSIRDFKAVNPEFGTAGDFRALVKQVHNLGMKLVLDWVANHAAWDNVWTNTHPEYFERDHDGHFKAPYDWTDVIQIDHACEAEQDAMIDAMQYWVREFDIDGFRADLAHLTPLPFWKKARTAMEPLKENLFWLAETEDFNYHEVFDVSFTWEWMHKTDEYCKGMTNVDGLKMILHRYYGTFPASAYRMYFTSNHDENSWNGTEYEKYHDMAHALAVFSCTWNGIPLIYSGQELPNLRRLKFFDKDPIDWTGTARLHDFYKTLLSLKKRNMALRACDPQVSSFMINTTRNDVVLAYLRMNGENAVLVMLNLSKEEITFSTEDSLVEGNYTDVFSASAISIDAGREFLLPPGGYLVYEKCE